MSIEHLELEGVSKDQVLHAIRKQFSEWGLAVPDVEPLPLHFGLNRFLEVGETEFWLANEIEHGYCGKYLFLFDGQTCPRHKHAVKHETFYILKGQVRMNLGDEEMIMNEGDVLAMQTGTWHSFTGIGPALVLEISMPSIVSDNTFADPAIQSALEKM
jgi:mannose-6-phosphate isomerase-like protein (cupin superfamily)